jgi:predicted Rossmann-fold nucleotide-binding protein
VLLVGREYWAGLVDWIRARLLEERMISPPDLDLFRCTDDIDEIVAVCAHAADRQEGTATGSG